MDEICKKCDGLIARPGVLYGWGGSFCYCQRRFENTAIVSCIHCYCQKVNPVIGNTAPADHKKCCNCGNMQKIPDYDKV